MFAVDELFSDVLHYAGLNDAYYEHFNESLPVEELRIIFDKLPQTIKDDACHYGLSDTVVRDEIYVYFRDNS